MLSFCVTEAWLVVFLLLISASRHRHHIRIYVEIGVVCHVLGGQSRSNRSHVLIQLACEVTRFKRAHINGQLGRIAFVLIRYTLLTNELRFDLTAKVLLPHLIHVESLVLCVVH